MCFSNLPDGASLLLAPHTHGYHGAVHSKKKKAPNRHAVDQQSPSQII